MQIERLEDRRLLSAGEVDPYFGTGGSITLSTEGGDQSQYDFRPLADGRILTAFATSQPVDKVGVPDRVGFQIQRLNSDGRIDERFRTSPNSEVPGVFVETIGNRPYVRIVRRPSGGFFIFADSALFAFTNDGEVDTSFGVAGRAALAPKILPAQIGIRSDGSILVTGNVLLTASGDDVRFAIGALNADGTFDSTFGDEGVMTMPIADVDFPYSEPDVLSSGGISVVMLPDDSAYVIGEFRYYEQFVIDLGDILDFDYYSDIGLIVARIRPDNTFDTSFGPTGIRQTDAIDESLRLGDCGTGKFDNYQGATFNIRAAARGTDAVVMADDGVNVRVLIVRPDGSVAKLYQPHPDDEEWFTVQAESFTPLTDGGALLGVTHLDDDDPGFELHRLRPDGTLDPSFNSTAAAAATEVNAPLSIYSMNTRIAAADGSVLMMASVYGQSVADPTPLTLHRFWRDEAPAAEVNIIDINSTSSRSQVLTVTYRDDSKVDRRSLDQRDLRITGPNGFVAYAKFDGVLKSRNRDGWIRARYKVAAPGGSWDVADNGTYSIRLRGDQVFDVDGHAAGARTIGTFRVNVPSARVFRSHAAQPGRTVQPLTDVDDPMLDELL